MRNTFIQKFEPKDTECWHSISDVSTSSITTSRTPTTHGSEKVPWSCPEVTCPSPDKLPGLVRTEYGDQVAVEVFIWCYTWSMDDNSVEYSGHTITGTCLCRTHAWVIRTGCGWALSCCNAVTDCALTWIKGTTAGCSMLSMYSRAVRVPSKMTSCVGSRVVIPPQTITLAPPQRLACRMHASSNRSPRRRHTCWRLSGRSTQIRVSSVKGTEFHSLRRCLRCCWAHCSRLRRATAVKMVYGMGLAQRGTHFICVKPASCAEWGY